MSIEAEEIAAEIHVCSPSAYNELVELMKQNIRRLRHAQDSDGDIEEEG